MRDLGITAQSGTVDQRCADREFVNSPSISNGVVCYNGTTEGSRAVYFCSDDSQTAVIRICQANGTWSESVPSCSGIS